MRQRTRDVGAILLILIGGTAVLVAAWRTDPRLGLALLGLIVGGCGAVLGLQRW